jgi:hypothetical protein
MAIGGLLKVNSDRPVGAHGVTVPAARATAAGLRKGSDALKPISVIWFVFRCLPVRGLREVRCSVVLDGAWSGTCTAWRR